MVEPENKTHYYDHEPVKSSCTAKTDFEIFQYQTNFFYHGIPQLKLAHNLLPMMKVHSLKANVLGAVLTNIFPAFIFLMIPARFWGTR